MPELNSIDSAVEKMVQATPPVKTGEEQPVTKAPVEEAPVKGAEETPASEKSEEGTELSAFEQELIEEFKEEYDSLPEGDRKPFLAALKRSYRKQAKQMTELGTLRKAVSALREAGVTNEDLVKLIQEKRGGTKAEAQRVVDQTTGNGQRQRGYQRWLEQAKTPEERESLRDAEQVVREVIEDVLTARIEEIRDKEVKPLRERLDYHDRQMLTKRAQSLEQDINDLEDKLGYPGSLVETHREAMRQLGLREPELSVEDLLVRVAGFSTVKAAMLKVASKSSEEATEEGRSQKPPASVIKKPGPQEMPRNQRGVIPITRALDLLMKPKR